MESDHAPIGRKPSRTSSIITAADRFAVSLVRWLSGQIADDVQVTSAVLSNAQHKARFKTLLTRIVALKVSKYCINCRCGMKIRPAW